MEPVSTPIAWNEGSHHEIGWMLLIWFLSMGLLMNCLQILVHISIPKLWDLPNAPTILALAIQDGLFDLLCLVSCTTHLIQHELQGESECTWQSFYGVFLMTWSGLSIMSLYYSCYVNIVEGRTLSKKQVFKFQVGMATYCLTLTLLAVIYPGQPWLNSSGLFCYTAFHLPPEAVLFYVGYLGPMFGGLVYMNWKLEHGLTLMKETMKEYGLAIQPRPLQLDILRSMRIYVGVMVICYSPILSVCLYIWGTGDHPPPSMWIVTALAGHANTVINPVLYYILSVTARRALFQKIHRIFGCHCTASYELCDAVSDKIAYNAYFEVLINSRAGKEVLKKEAEVHFAPELTKFYFEDHPAWLALCFRERGDYGKISRAPSVNGSASCEIEMGSIESKSSCTTVLTTPSKVESTGRVDLGDSSPGVAEPTKIDLGDSGRGYELRSPATSNSQIEPLIENKKLDDQALYLYRTYIEDMAPLSLNLSDTLRQDVEDRLYGYGGSTIVASQDPNPSTMFVEVERVVKELIFNNIYHAAFHSPEMRKEFEAHQRVLDSSNKGPL